MRSTRKRLASEDITFCNKQKCKIMSCERNPNHIKRWHIPHSYAQLENTEYCPKRGKKDDGGADE